MKWLFGFAIVLVWIISELIPKKLYNRINQLPESVLVVLTVIISLALFIALAYVIYVIPLRALGIDFDDVFMRQIART